MPSLRSLTCLLVLSTLTLPGGCGGKPFMQSDRGPAEAAPRTSGFPTEKKVAARSVAEAPPRRYYVQYDVLRVELPRGTVSRSEVLWNHVDESVFPFAVTRRLRLNGLRIGLADQSAWPAIKALLDGSGAVQAAQVGLTQDDLLPFAIEIDPTSRDRTIFHYGPGDRLEGSSYADSLNLLRIEHYLDPERLSGFTLRLVPEVRRAHPRTTLAATAGGLREIAVYEGRIFTSLGVDMEVPESSIIVVGPSDRAGRQALLGTEFLCGHRNGVDFERVFFITPRLVARQRAGARFLPDDG